MIRIDETTHRIIRRSLRGMDMRDIARIERMTEDEVARRAWAYKTSLGPQPADDTQRG